MSSLGNAIQNWSIRSAGDISDLQHKLVSDGCARSSPPIKAMAAVVDSAYSSFSGSSYVTDYQPFQHGTCHLDNEQISYMDSDYVKAIYNPSAVDQRNSQQNLGSEDCSSKNYPSGRITKLSNNSQVTLNEEHFPSVRINNYTTIQHFEHSDLNRESGDHFSHKSKRSPTNTSDLSSPEHKLSRHYIEDHSPTWVRNSIHGEWNQSCVASCNQEKEDYPNFTSSSFLSSVGSLAKSHNVNCIGNENNSHSQMSVLNTDCLKQKDFQTIQQICVKKEEQNPSNMFNLFMDYGLNEGVVTKSTRRSLDELVSEKIEVRSGSWKPAQETNCYNDEGIHSEGVVDLAHNQVRKEQYRPQPQNMKDLECDSVGQWDTKYKSLHTKNSQILYSRSSEDLFEHPSKALNRDDLQKVSKAHVSKDATIKPIPLLSQEQELTMPLTSNFCELTSEKITKATTPMLYHLAGGKNNSLVMLNFKNQPKHLDENSESKTFQATGNSTTPQVAEPQKSLHKTRSHSQLVDNSANDHSECETAGNLTSSEESFMYDYREKLKVAQKKVLRETSFKRKDLQMSLPVRLKWNAPKRPSIDHVRSYSLSGSNEEAKFVQPKTLVDNSSKQEEPEKSIISRIGGRKRLTKEQRKLCYSEPEKLDHIGVHNSISVWNNEGSSQTKLGEHHRMKSTDKERTLSSSNLSKTDLKQIQHNALVEYMERKANQRPSSIHQSQMQKPSGIKTVSEWKYLANEMSSNDLPQPYYHRRSTGASSSYDATVTWNDRLLKMSQGDVANLVDKAVNGRHKSCLDQSPCYFEDFSEAVSQKYSKSVNHPQAPAEHLTSSASAPSSNNHVCDNRLSVRMESTTHEKEQVCTARGRGKSMEELGTSDRIRLSVLSQSSEQLHHMKGPVLGPQSGNVSGTAVVHQDKLKSSPEPGSQARQTSREDLLGPHRSDIAKSAHERHSRPQRASGASPGIDNSSISPPLQIYPRTTEQSRSLQTDNEVFSQPNSTSMDDACRPPNISQEDLQAHSPLRMHSNLQQQATHTPSLEVNEKNSAWCNNEVRAEANALCKSSVFKEPSVSVAEIQDPGAVNEESKSTNVQSMSTFQQMNVDIASSIHKNETEAAGSSIHGKSNVNDEASGQESCMEEQSDAPRENLTKFMLQSHVEERYTALVKEITAKDKSLVDVLKPLPVRESAISLMKSLFSVDISTRRSRNRDLKNNKMNIEGLSKSHSKTMLPEKTSSQKPDGECLDDITLLKVELLSSINSQLEELFGERELLLSEISENTNYGTNIEAVVKEVCKPNEYERYMMFIGDLEKVVSLLFCLSMRLARVENALSKIDKNTDAEEIQSLKERHSLLSRQREDAKDLKDNLDRREQVVTGILAKYLSKTQLEDYKHFVRLKTLFLIEQKDLDEKIKFHEEQLESLHNRIPP